MNNAFEALRENIHCVMYGINNSDDFLLLVLKGQLSNGLVVSGYNKVYRRDIINSEMFIYRIYKDDDWSIRVLLKNKIFI